MRELSEKELFWWFDTGDELSVLSCEKHTEISCGLGNELKIKIRKAHFGKSNNQICPKKSSNAKCQGVDVTKKIAER